MQNFIKTFATMRHICVIQWFISRARRHICVTQRFISRARRHICVTCWWPTYMCKLITNWLLIVLIIHIMLLSII